MGKIGRMQARARQRRQKKDPGFRVRYRSVPATPEIVPATFARTPVPVPQKQSWLTQISKLFRRKG